MRARVTDLAREDRAGRRAREDENRHPASRRPRAGTRSAVVDCDVRVRTRRSVLLRVGVSQWVAAPEAVHARPEWIVGPTSLPGYAARLRFRRAAGALH